MANETNTGFTIISGGQTGADRAGLDFAITNNIPHGGWCPKGRRAEDGAIKPKYQLKETGSSNYLVRTHLNIQGSDATVIFTMAKSATGGSRKTIQFARQEGKPWLHLHRGMKDVSEQLKAFVAEHHIKKLNVAGSRESKERGIHDWVVDVLEEAFKS